jgi:small GTP-binding protein
MMNVLRGLQDRSIFKAKEERFLIIGNDASGKTTLLYRLKLNECVVAIPTIGFNVESVIHRKKTFTFWDVGGESFPLWLFVSN